jgi:formate hydrogenlyase subunit 3/multisubunit Na+/H+ antiporter MnhD subunit
LVRKQIEYSREKDKRRSGSWGGAAIEYIIVSTFATLFALAGILFVTQVMKSKVQKLEEKLGVTFDDEGVGSLFK